MGTEPRYAVTADQMRALDASATHDFGIASIFLMENAGRSAAETAAEMLVDVHGRRVLVACGSGNNGGDGFVVARHLHGRGACVIIALVADRGSVRGDALTNLEAAERIGLEIRPVDSTEALAEMGRGVDLVVDALLGTGTHGSIREPYAGAIDAINGLGAQGALVLAADIPSGVDSDSGALLGPAVDADMTVTFAMPKIGLLTYPGAERAGRLIVADIGIPPEAAERMGLNTYVLDEAVLAEVVQRPQRDAHKGDMGRVAIVAGSVGLTGAAALSAEGALRIGAGLVTVAVPESLNDILEVKLTEAMTVPVPQGRARAFGPASLDAVMELIDKSDAAVIGPGLGRHEDTIAFVLELVRKLSRPAVIDADGLYAISTSPGILKECKASVVVTPHPGEMAGLIGKSIEEVQSRRLECARDFAAENSVAVVLKGAATVVAMPDGSACMNTSGTSGMATGGTGDVLSGMIGGLMARHGLSITSVGGAVYLHGVAGEIAAAELGEEAMLASDLARCAGHALRLARVKLQDRREEMNSD